MKSFLQLEVNQPHLKSQYSIKKNKLILLNKQKTIPFDHICYDYKSTNQKLLYQLLLCKQPQYELSSQGKIIITVLFNYHLQYEKLQNLFAQLIQIKKFQNSKFKIAHYQLRSNHISDYNKTNQRIRSDKDQMEKFTKQIDTCLKLDKSWNIKENIKFKEFNKNNFQQMDILNKKNRTNYQKKTNQFFICEIDDTHVLNFIVLHRQKDYVLTKNEQRQIQELILIKGNTRQKGKIIDIQFSTSLAQIIKSYLNQSQFNVFASLYPRKDHTLQEVLEIPFKFGQIRDEQIQKIIKTYNKEKENKFQYQMQKMKNKLKELIHKKKVSEDNITFLTKKYKKGFQSIFQSLTYLNKNGITDIKSFRENLQSQIKQITQEIQEELHQLKSLNQQMIQSEERSAYFKEKMEILKDDLEDCLQKMQGKKPKRVSVINQKVHQKQLVQTVLNKFLNAEQNIYSTQIQRELQRYKSELKEKTKQKMMKSKQKADFNAVLQGIRKKTTKNQFVKIQQRFLHLLGQH